MEVNEKIKVAYRSIRKAQKDIDIMQILKIRTPFLLKQIQKALNERLWNDNVELSFFIGDLENYKTAVLTKLEKYRKEYSRDQIDELIEYMSNGDADYIAINKVDKKRNLLKTIVNELNSLYLQLCDYQYLANIIRFNN